MECRSVESHSDSKPVGVTVDLVPGYLLTSTNATLRDEASAFLPFSLQQYAERGDLYRLIPDDCDPCDMGLIENQLMRELPERKKRVFRVLKFLNQNVHRDEISEFPIVGLDEPTCLRLYGYKPLFPSYLLRLVFLNLLQHIHGTDTEDKLTDGRLLLCLIDMLQTYYYLVHPFIRNYSVSYGMYFSGTDGIKSVLDKLQSMNENVNLLNNKTPSQMFIKDTVVINNTYILKSRVTLVLFLLSLSVLLIVTALLIFNY